MWTVNTCLIDQSIINYSQKIINRTSVLLGDDGAENIATNVTTDSVGKLSVQYNNSNSETPSPTTIYQSSITKDFTRNCGVGFQGTTVSYTVNVYSLVSQEDADNIALSRVTKEGQNYAQTVGICQCALLWNEPTLVSQNGKVKLTVVIAGATEYRVGGSWVTTNEFLLTKEGNYTVEARNSSCYIKRDINIRINPENDIYNIFIKGFTCGSNYPNEPVISSVILKNVSCKPVEEGISNIRFFEEACSLQDIADINNIKLLKTC